MQAGQQHELRGSQRSRPKFPNRPAPGRVLLILIVAAFLFMPASGEILAQSGFVPFSNSIIGLDVSPVDASVVLAGTLNVPVPAGIYLSNDGGHTWSRAQVDLPPNTSVASIRYDPQDASRALAADGGVGNLFISEDGGLTWEQELSINRVLTPNSGVGRLFARIENGQTVFYAGTRFDGAVRSAAGGTDWEWYGNGLTGGGLRVRAFVEKDGVLYAGTHDGVWRLPEDADTWERVDMSAGVIVRGMTVLEGRLYVGTFASGLFLSDDGESWIQDPSFPAGVVIYDLIVSGDQVIVGTNVGLWTQNQPDWVRAPVNGAIYSSPVYRLAASPSSVGITYAGTEQDGVLRTIDGGATFLSSAQITPLDPADVPGPLPTTPAVRPTRTPLATWTPTDSPPTDTPPPTATATATATRDPNAPTETPTATDAPVAPTSTPTVTGTPLPTPTAGDMPAGAPTTPETETPSPSPSATSTPGPVGNVRDSLTRLPPIWVGGAAVFFLLILVVGISVARDGASGDSRFEEL